MTSFEDTETGGESLFKDLMATYQGAGHPGCCPPYSTPSGLCPLEQLVFRDQALRRESPHVERLSQGACSLPVWKAGVAGRGVPGCGLLLVAGTVLHGLGFERPVTAPASALVEATLLTGRVSRPEAPWPRGAEAAAPPAGP